MQSVIINTNQAGQRLDKFLRKYLPAAGSSFLYKMLRKKNITLNDKRAEGKEMLAVGDKVCFFFAEETFQKFSGCKTQLQEATAAIAEYQRAYEQLKGISVLYEDENVLFVNKPAGILTQKATPSEVSLNEWLIGYLLNTEGITVEELHSFHPSVCNRLDRNTSGIVLCGKTLAGSQLLSRLIKERTIRKFYRTICMGRLTATETLEGYLIKDAVSNRVTISSSESAGAYIKTSYSPLRALKDYTLLEVELITGKPHQIRAHLASIGHPIVGDSKYGDRRKNQRLLDILPPKAYPKAQLLHAYRIVFPTEDASLPLCLCGRVITAPYPPLFKTVTQYLGLEEDS